MYPDSAFGADGIHVHTAVALTPPCTVFHSRNLLLAGVGDPDPLTVVDVVSDGVGHSCRPSACVDCLKYDQKVVPCNQITSTDFETVDSC